MGGGDTDAACRSLAERLGLPLGDFIFERLGPHMAVWALAGLAGGTAMLAAEAKDGFWTGLGSALLVEALVLLVMLIVLGLAGPAAAVVAFVPLAIALALVALPTVLGEAWLRLRLRLPYFIPVTSPHHPHYEPLPLPPPEPPAPRAASGGGWLLPLVIGVWLGGFFGDDD